MNAPLLKDGRLYKIMKNILIVHFTAAILCTLATSSRVEDPKKCFPKHFAFGVATAAFEIEGAWNVSGKGESIWDRYTHEYPDRVFDHLNADVAADSYHLFKEDVYLLRQLGVQFYRFSISWPRIMPTGLSNDINEDGIRYYNDLLEELSQNNIMPLVTMYHWDLPQSLQELGGWTNPIMADYFVDYARVLFSSFGNKVALWITFNEPFSFCQEGYGGSDAPGSRSSGFEDYLCGHNVLRAHGMVYRMYEQEFKRNQNGHISITLDFSWPEASSTSEDDEEAAETCRQFRFGWFANPIFSKSGDYPEVMRTAIDKNSLAQGFMQSRLPKFSPEEVDMIRGSADFLAMNHYTTYLIKKGTGNISTQPSFKDDEGVTVHQKNEWPRTNSTWVRVVPWGFRKALNWLKKTYDNPIIVVTENGVPYEAGIHDVKRVHYIQAYLAALLDAITKDGCNVIAYTHWSLIDNFEWMRGFSERFGLYEVDYKSSKKIRRPRLSARYYAHIAQTKCIPLKFPDNIYEYA